MSGTNPIATFVRSLFTTQDPTTYRTALDGNAAVAQRIVDNFAPHQSGGSATFTGTISTNVLNVSAISSGNAVGGSCSFATSVMTCTIAPTSGTFQVGQPVYANGVAPGTTITSLGTGTGGLGTYNLSTSPGTIGAESTTAGFAAPLVVGAIIAGAGVTIGSQIISFGTGTGGTGAYNLSVSSTVGTGEAMTSVPGMNVTLDAGNLNNGQTITEVAQQVSSAFAIIVKPVTYPRIDRIVIDKTAGYVSIITGTEASSPTAPTLTASVFPVAQVLLQTSTVSIVNSMITDERSEFISVGAYIAAAPVKATPVAADKIGILDSVTGLLKSIAASFLFASGDVKSSASSAAQTGWLACDGTSYTTAAQPSLFASIGYVWGGSGANFNVPDFRGRALIGDGTGSGLSARTVGQETIGEETHLLTTPEIPLHTHTANDSGHTHTIPYNLQGVGAAGGGTPIVGATAALGTSTSYANITLSGTGGSSVHNNMQPSAVIHWLIKT